MVEAAEEQHETEKSKNKATGKKLRLKKRGKKSEKKEKIFSEMKTKQGGTKEQISVFNALKETEQIRVFNNPQRNNQIEMGSLYYCYNFSVSQNYI